MSHETGMLKVEQSEDGTWRVITRDGQVLASGLTNAQAWDIADKHDNGAINDEETRRRIGRAFSGE